MNNNQPQKMMIDDMNISIYLKNTLKINRILDTEQVFKYSPKELMRLYKFGKKSYIDLIGELEKLGYDVSVYKNYLKLKRKDKINVYDYPHNLLFSVFGEKTVFCDNVEQVFYEVLSTLPSHYQTTLNLRFKEKLTLKECSKIMCCSYSAVYKFQKLAFDMLREEHRAKYLLYNNIPIPVKNKYATSKIINIPIINLGFDKKTEQALFKNNVSTIGDLIKNIENIKIGVKSKELIKSKIRLFGFEI